MGPPLSIWPYSTAGPDCQISDKFDNSDNVKRKCLKYRFADSCRVLCLNLTFVLVLSHVIFNLNCVNAGPVVLSLDYMQGPVPLARNIRHLPCISRRTKEEGLCMFAIDCLKANGTHLGTCIDRFYFGSCCQIPDRTILPQIILNHEEDNTIDGASFVHPQTEDKIENTATKQPEVTVTKEKVEATTESKAQTVPVSLDLPMETKSDDITTLDNKIPDDDAKLTTAVYIETTTKAHVTSKIPLVTEIPVKLSTFQSVSHTNQVVTDNPNKQETTDVKLTTTTEKTTTRLTTRQPVTRKTNKPSYKPRPTYRPSNSTRPTFNASKPRPTKPISIFNSTRRPPYKNPPKRPTTKKPLPLPPRLNITIIPQLTSSRPAFTRPQSTTITFINTTSTTESRPISTTQSTTTEPTTSSTTTSTTTSTTSAPTTISSSASSSILTTLVERATETNTPEATETSSPITEAAIEKLTVTSTTSTTEATTTVSEETKETTALTQEVATEKEILRPVTEADVTTTTKTASSTEFPPFVTWSSNIETATKAPEQNVTETTDENWSPITPPEGWILISTIPPKQESPSTTTTTTTELPTTASETLPPAETTVIASEKVTENPTTVTTVSEILTSSPTATAVLTSESESKPDTKPTESSQPATETEPPKLSSSSTTTQAPLLEFTVNVTLTPTLQSSTSSIGLTTFSSVSSDNSTELSTLNGTTTAVTAISETASNDSVSTSESSGNATTVSETSTTTTENPYNMTNFKDVCGRRLWPEARIVGGAKSGFGRWPWQISLRQYRTSTYLHKCGAALLNENWAITAAHCVEHVPPSELLVRLGEHDLANENEPFGFAERRVQIVASHPHFDPATFEYDLALLRFYEPVTFQPNILPVCVPDNDDNFVGRTAHVTGWGRLYDEGPLPSVLQEVDVPVINNTACEAMYQAAGYNEHIPNIFICAGWRKGGADSCEGDSGGPMVVQRERDGRFVLGGVISWGIGCAEPNQPGVYTRISEFRDWINQILQF